MKIREFNKHLNSCRVLRKGRPQPSLDPQKVRALDSGIRHRMVEYLVRQRAAVLEDLIPASISSDWLAACGYLYRAENDQWRFRICMESMVKSLSLRLTNPQQIG